MRLPRQLHPCPSRIGLALLVGFHLAAMLAAAASAYAGVAVFICLGVLLCVLVSLGITIRSCRHSPHGLRLGRGGELSVMVGGSKAWQSVSLLPETTTWEFAVLIRWSWQDAECQGGKGRGGVLIGRDSLPPDDFRALCVWLRWRERLRTSPV